MRVLVVEDNHRVAGFIIKGLQEEHYSVDHAADGDEAVRLARGGVYDAILLDIMLPGRDGFAVTAALRQNGCQTPILMLTAKGSVEDKVRGLDQGADDYLTKPFAFAELLARLRALLRRQSSEAEAVLKIADLTMDPVTHVVFRGGRKIELTAKEYGVLEFLLRNKNRVVTRTTLIEHVWDMNFDSDTNLVDVYIRYLRKKVDEDFELKLIQTVRGVGYTLKDS
jgi:heavy metal response regulator